MECLYGSHCVGSELREVLVGVVEDHLPGKGMWSLGVDGGEFGLKVVESVSDFSQELGTKALPHSCCGLDGTTEVVVEQDEGDVVPVLRLAATAGRGGFRQQEPPPGLRR